MRRVVYVIRQISCFYLCVCFLLLLSNHHTQTYPRRLRLPLAASKEYILFN
jgi:hypothetical protein